MVERHILAHCSERPARHGDELTAAGREVGVGQEPSRVGRRCRSTGRRDPGGGDGDSR